MEILVNHQILPAKVNAFGRTHPGKLVSYVAGSLQEEGSLVVIK